jgi:hypothetical protein
MFGKLQPIIYNTHFVKFYTACTAVSQPPSNPPVWLAVYAGISRSSSSKPAQLPPLFEHKSNMIDFILTSKCSNKLHAAEPSSETFSDIAKLLTVVEPDEKMTVRTGKQ